MMQIDILEHLPEEFSPSSRVWIYQSSRLFTMSEAYQLDPLLQSFAASWQSHGQQVKAYANLFYGRFIILMADETQAAVSGCSTDSSMHFIQSIEKQFAVSLTDRQLLAFMLPSNKIELVPLAQFSYALNAGLIDADTLYFNNVVLTKQALLHNWLIPVKDSWLRNKLPQPGA